MDKIKLFCIPYAGGSAMVYLTWKKHLHNRIELVPVELAGRGRRFSEPLYRSAEEAVEDIFNRISGELESSPYALFGHSMGSLLAYELTRKILASKLQEPLHVFFSGRHPPYAPGEKKGLHLLPDEEFIAEFYKLGGINEELLKNKELLDIFVPIIRADYRIVEEHIHKGDIPKLNSNISALNGKNDTFIVNKDISRWKECTNKNCRFYEFNDGHFFINSYREEVTSVINDTLLHFVWVRLGFLSYKQDKT